MRAVVDRASSRDLLQALDVGAPPHAAAVLVLDRALDLAALRDVLADRIRGVPRMRQCLVETGFGCGRPIWVDHPGFDIDDHVSEVPCDQPGDQAALLAVVARTVLRDLPRDRPLWSATLVSGLAGARSAVAIVIHHVLADGVGGLAVLARLVDGAPTVGAVEFPRPPPSARDVFLDATGSRLRAVLRLPSGARLIGAALTELRPGRAAHASRCSLNRPTGRRRALGIARADLAALRATAHCHTATINDALLVAVGGALGRVLRHRGESVDSFVLSVPISGRRHTSVAHLGNQVGAMPVPVPAFGTPEERLAEVARATRARRNSPGRGASAAALAPLFRLLAAVGALQWFIDRQRFITSIVTNLPGPEAALSLLGATVSEIVPVSTDAGNVTVAFAALSYDGRLVVTVVADPETCPDHDLVVTELQAELDALAMRTDAITA